MRALDVLRVGRVRKMVIIKTRTFILDFDLEIITLKTVGYYYLFRGVKFIAVSNSVYEGFFQGELTISPTVEPFDTK